MAGTMPLSRRWSGSAIALTLAGAGGAGWLVQAGGLEGVRTTLALHASSWQLDEILVLLLAPIIIVAVLSSVATLKLRRASARSIAERDLARRLALCDPLTGLLNRRGLDEALAELPPGPHRVVLIDIDDFKSVNDEHGHTTGDAILRDLAARLQTLVQEQGVIAARLGGDEMVVIAQSRGVFAAALQETLVRPLLYGLDGSLQATVSVGGAELEDGSFLDALERADADMYDAKRSRALRREATDTTRVFETELQGLSGPEEFCVHVVQINRAGDGGRPLSYGQAGPLTRAVRAALAAALPDLPIERLSNDVLGIAAPVSARDEVTQVIGGLAVACQVDGVTHHARLTIGRAGPRSRLELRDAVEQAQLALETARRDGRSIADFDEADRAALRSNVALLRDLRDAIQHDTLELHYQPKLNLRTNTVDSLEALVRWTHPEFGPVSPGFFIPLAEESGDIRAITRWVFSTACRASAKLQQQGLEQPIYVNVSALLVADEAFVADLIEEASRTGARLGIEVTETACLEQPERALINLQRLTDAGLRIAIDDYGVGLSSLTYLRQMPASELKIDMSFIRDLSESHRDPLIVRSTIDLAHALEMKVTAEGVDKPEILALLRVMGCDYVQGFEIAPALDLVACIAMLHEGVRPEAQLPDFAIQLRRFIKPVVQDAIPADHPGQCSAA
jgi:diguanylate cyclase (GGDEF)-like protein